MIKAVVLLALVSASLSLYCGNKDCYELLQVDSTASSQEIKKAFRRLAIRYHPDRVKEQDTTELFQQINQAYEILDNPYTRKEYDSYRADPHQHRIKQYYNYYKAVYCPQTNPFLVLFVFISLLSVLHYVMRKSMYETAIKQIVQTDLYKRTVNERWDGKRDKDEVREEVKQEICLAGGRRPPKIQQILIFRLILLPYTFGLWIYSWARWIYLYKIRRVPYTSEDQEYLTCKALKISKDRWSMFQESEQALYLNQKLWIPENMQVFMEQNRKRRQQQLAQSNKYKRYVRAVKKNS